MYSSWYFFQILNKLGFSWQIFIHIPKIKFHESPSIGSDGDTCGQVEVEALSAIMRMQLEMDTYENYLLWWQQRRPSPTMYML